MSKNNFDNMKRRLADVYIADRRRIEDLQTILSDEQNRPVTYEEARAIGTDLLDLYKALAGDRKITKGGLDNIQKGI